MLIYQLLQKGTASTRPPLYQNQSDGWNNHGRTTASQTMMLACSSSSSSSSALNQRYHDLIYANRKLCEDRRGVFDHLRPRSFVRNTVRIVVMQSTTVVTTYFNDQLKEDTEREERIQKGDITRAQANKEDEEWQEREWNRRMEALPHRIMVAYLKYHSITLVMRLYEHIAAKMYSEEKVDKLTMDTFEAAKRESARTGKSKGLGSEMLRVCWNANIISFLADYSVHQVILAYAYYAYIREQRRKIKNGGGDNDSESTIHGGSVALSFVRKSTLLALSRGVCLGFASIGGALGSTVWPGWGTLAGSNIGDTVGFSLMEDVMERPAPSHE